MSENNLEQLFEEEARTAIPPELRERFERERVEISRVLAEKVSRIIEYAAREGAETIDVRTQISDSLNQWKNEILRKESYERYCQYMASTGIEPLSWPEMNKRLGGVVHKRIVTKLELWMDIEKKGIAVGKRVVGVQGGVVKVVKSITPSAYLTFEGDRTDQSYVSLFFKEPKSS